RHAAGRAAARPRRRRRATASPPRERRAGRPSRRSVAADREPVVAPPGRDQTVAPQPALEAARFAVDIGDELDAKAGHPALADPPILAERAFELLIVLAQLERHGPPVEGQPPAPSEA